MIPVGTEETSPAALVQPLVDLVAQASAAIMTIYGSAFTVHHKSDRSPLTEADRAAHRLLTDGLGRLTPSVPVLSEESAPSGHEHAVRGGWRELWLVDPLDGTREFIGRNGEFTVNVALIQDHRPTLGVVAAPALGVTYLGGAGLGSFRVRDGQAGEPIRTRAAGDPIRVVGSRSHRGQSLDSLLARLGAHELLPMGSALKFCLVAEGAADLYPRIGPTSEWDTAAGQAVLEAAGGAVVGLSGEPLLYNRRPTLINPSFLAYGDPSREWRHLL